MGPPSSSSSSSSPKDPADLLVQALAQFSLSGAEVDPALEAKMKDLAEALGNIKMASAERDMPSFPMPSETPKPARGRRGRRHSKEVSSGRKPPRTPTQSSNVFTPMSMMNVSTTVCKPSRAEYDDGGEPIPETPTCSTNDENAENGAVPMSGFASPAGFGFKFTTPTPPGILPQRLNSRFATTAAEENIPLAPSSSPEVSDYEENSSRVPTAPGEVKSTAPGATKAAAGAFGKRVKKQGVSASDGASESVSKAETAAGTRSGFSVGTQDSGFKVGGSKPAKGAKRAPGRGQRTASRREDEEQAGKAEKAFVRGHFMPPPPPPSASHAPSQIPAPRAAGTLRAEKAQEHARRAEVMAAEGRCGDAIQELSRAIAIAPSDWPPRAMATLYCGRGAGHLELGRHEAAVNDCHEALARNPMLSRAAALLGRACLQLGQFQPAEAAFGSALQLCMANIEGSSPAEIQEIRSACDVGISEAYSGRAQLTSMGRAEMRGDILAAAESAKAILSIAPRCMTALSTLASALAATAQWNQAAAFCVTYCLVPQEAAGSDSWPPPPGSLCTAQAALLMGPGPSQVYVTSLVATGRGMEARIAMSALLCRAPGLGWCRQLQALVTRIDKLRADANTKAAAKEHAQSAQLLTEALDSMLQLMPGSPAASGILCARSAVMVSMGRWQDARSDAKEALGLSPALPEALLACARAAAGQGGDLQDAIQGYEVYLSSHPEDQAAAAELRDVKAKLQSQSRRDAKAQESAKGPATTSSPKSKANSAKTPAKGRRNSFIPQPKAAAPTPAKTSSSRTRSQYATDDTHLRAVTTPGKAKTLYEVLGVNQDADSVKVKKAYRALALRYHPDKSKAIDAAERFKGLNEAYSVLSSPGKKNQYDQELAMRYMAVN